MKFNISIQRPRYGSRWYYGNFMLGIEVNSHPRFFEVVIGFVLFEIIIHSRKFDAS